MWNHAEIVFKLKDPFDYDEYIQSVDNPIEPWMYGQKVGFLLVCKKRYAELSLDKAQLAMTREMNAAHNKRKTLSTQNEQSKSDCCGGKKKTPSIIQKGVNFTKALTEHIITGMKHVPRGVFIQRLEKCKDCPSLQDGFVCTECGCYMGIKASWLEQKCKLNKW